MPDKPACFLIAGAWAAAVFAQPTTGTLDQVIHLTRADTDQQLQEIATDLRGITEIQASVDTKQKILILHGTAGQITAAEWLANQFENPVQQPHEYRLASDDIVRVFFFAHAETPRRLQEAATNIRSIGHTAALHLQWRQRHNRAWDRASDRALYVAGERIGPALKSTSCVFGFA